MNRGRGTASLKNLVFSIKNSIIKDIPKIKADLRQQRSGMGRAKSTVNLAANSNCHQIRTPFQQTTNLGNTEMSMKTSSLKKQIHDIELQIEQETSGKSVGRNYDKALQLYDWILDQVKEAGKNVQQKLEDLDQAKNGIRMLKQDLASQQFNTSEILAEKQYYEEIIGTYQNQYENQSQTVLEIADLQFRNCLSNRKLNQNQLKIEKFRKQLEEWKQQNNYDYNVKKAQGKLISVRVDLMNIEQKADSIAKESGCPKLRQLLCMFVKQYNSSKMKVMKNKEMVEGLQLYVCKQEKTKKLRSFLLQKVNENKKYTDLVERYCRDFQKMQNIIQSGSSKTAKKIVQGYKLRIDEILAENHQFSAQINENQETIKELNSKLQLIFANESIILIQLMREKTGKIDLDPIKTRLKETATDQGKRVKRIKEIFRRNKEIKLDRQHYEALTVLEKIRGIQSEVPAKLKVLEKARTELLKEEKEKSRLQEKLSQAVTAWRQHQRKKKQLKKLCEQERQSQLMEERVTKKAQKENRYIPPFIESHVMVAQKLGRSTQRIKLNHQKTVSIFNQPMTATVQVTANHTFRDKKAMNRSKALSERGFLTNLLVSKFAK